MMSWTPWSTISALSVRKSSISLKTPSRFLLPTINSKSWLLGRIIFCSLMLHLDSMGRGSIFCTWEPCKLLAQFSPINRILKIRTSKAESSHRVFPKIIPFRSICRILKNSIPYRIIHMKIFQLSGGRFVKKEIPCTNLC